MDYERKTDQSGDTVGGLDGPDEGEVSENRSNSPSAAVTYIEPKWTSALALIIAGVALGLSIMVCYVQSTAYRELERESRLLQLKVDDMAVALKARGIDPTPSHEGNSP